MVSPPSTESTMLEKTTRSNSSDCPDGHVNPVAAAAAADDGSGPVRSDPVALPFFAAGNRALASRFPTNVVLFAGARHLTAAVDAHVDRLEGRGQAGRDSLLDSDDDNLFHEDAGVGDHRGGRRFSRRERRSTRGRAAVDQHRIGETQDVGKPCPGGGRDGQAADRNRHEQSQMFPQCSASLYAQL